jgi:large subunit ribosomal protein L29
MAKTKKQTKNQEIATMSVEQLQSAVAEGTNKLQRMKFSHAITPIENPMAIRTQRRELAKLKTAQRRKQLGF